MSELTAQIHTVEEKGHPEREGLLDQLHRLTSDNSSNKLQNQKLKVNICFSSLPVIECNKLKNIRHNKD